MIRRIVVGVLGGTVLLLGLALLVLPGPAFIVIPAGLAILATEFVWARRWLRKGREAFDKARGRPATVAPPLSSPAPAPGVKEGR